MLFWCTWFLCKWILMLNISLPFPSTDDVMERIFDDRTASDCKSLRGHKGAVYSASISPDRVYLLSASEDGTSEHWLILSIFFCLLWNLWPIMFVFYLFFFHFVWEALKLTELIMAKKFSFTCRLLTHLLPLPKLFGSSAYPATIERFQVKKMGTRWLFKRCKKPCHSLFGRPWHLQQWLC